MAPSSVIAAVRRYLALLNQEGIEARFGVLYGSQANGTADEWSDIDLLVVSSLFDGEYTYAQRATLWRLAARIDSRIEPVPCGDLQWKEDDGSPLIEIARREGQVIALRQQA
ncbi:MAG: nucleotidyltransferase domain-containing protein [Deltaproteobacteria bacterium]|nr:nucleotidyltransferase domain-containing protein [Deltaproteobacteria bacterium]